MSEHFTINTSIIIIFTKDMNNSTTVSDNIYLLKSGSKVPVKFAYDPAARKVTMEPNSVLDYDTVYTVGISEAVKDIIGQSIPQGSRTWTFTTEAKPSTGGGGGGGSISQSPGNTSTPAPVSLDSAVTAEVKLNADGTKTVEAKLSEAEFTKIFDTNKDAKEFVVEIKDSVENKLSTVPANVFAKLAESGASLVLKTNSATLSIPGGALKIADLARQLGVEAGKVEIKVSVKEVKQAEADKVKAAKEKGMTPVSKVLEFTMEAAANGKSVKIDSFGGKLVKGEFPFTPQEVAGVKNKAKLNVYKFNEATGKWQYSRSKVDAANNKVIFYTGTFSNYTIMEYDKTFADLAGHWARPDIELAASKYVVFGKTADNFKPADNVTRAEFAAMLVRALGLNQVKPAEGKFSDVKANAWYYADVETAAEAGLVNGISKGIFAPGKTISREEMSAMVVRALKAAGQEITLAAGEQDKLLAAFGDKQKIAGWALKDAVAALKAGIVQGLTKDSFAPTAKANRAQSAVMLKRMMEKAGLI